MVKRKARRSKDEVARLGRAMYARQIRRKLAGEPKGRVVAIDVDSGAYEVGDDVLETAERLLARAPRAEIWFARIGYRALHRFGSRRGAPSAV